MAPQQPQLGVELEITKDDLSGTALWHEGAVCHLAAFPVEKAGIEGDDFGFATAG